MSDFMTWILSILGVVIIGVILDIFLNDKKLGKLIRNIFASLVILIIVTPLPALLNTGGSCTDIFDTSEITLDNSFLEYINKQKVNALRDGLVEALAEKGYKNLEIEIDAEISTSVNIRLVKVYAAKVVIDGKNPNIYNDIREQVGKILDISTDKIIVFD